MISARATLEILIPDFVKQTAEEKPVEGDELEVLLLIRSIDLSIPFAPKTLEKNTNVLVLLFSILIISV